MIVYLNGSYVDASTAKISLFDGGYLFGDGLFETLRCYGGRPFDLEGHLERLQRQLDLLSYSWLPDGGTIRVIIDKLAKENDLIDQDARVRVTISRGAPVGNPLEMFDLEDRETTFSITLVPLPKELPLWQREGVSVQIMKPFFARGNFPQLKTLNYLPSLLANRFAHASQCQEALLVNRQGQMLEGASSNIFLIREGTFCTPPPRLGLLAGRTRAMVLEAARKLGHPCQELPFDRRDLFTAEEVFLTSSIKEVVPVVYIDGSPVASGRPGELTLDLQKQYRQDVENALADGTG